MQPPAPAWTASLSAGHRPLPWCRALLGTTSQVGAAGVELPVCGLSQLWLACVLALHSQRTREGVSHAGGSHIHVQRVVHSTQCAAEGGPALQMHLRSRRTLCGSCPSVSCAAWRATWWPAPLPWPALTAAPTSSTSFTLSHVSQWGLCQLPETKSCMMSQALLSS